MQAIFTEAGTALASSPPVTTGSLGRAGLRPGTLRQVVDGSRANPEPGRGAGRGGRAGGRELGGRWGGPIGRPVSGLVSRRDLLRLVQPVRLPGHGGLPGPLLRGLVGPPGRLHLSHRTAGEPVACGAAPEHQDRDDHQRPGDPTGQRRGQQDRYGEDAQREPGSPVGLQDSDTQHRGRRGARPGDHQPHAHAGQGLAHGDPQALAGRRRDHLGDLLAHLDRVEGGQGVEDQEQQQDRAPDHEPGRHRQLPGSGGGLAAGRAPRRVTHGVIEPTARADPLIRR